MKFVDPADLSNSLRQMGIEKGHTVLIHADISRLGWMKSANGREDVLRTYLQAILEVLGPEGTLAALSCTESYARHNRPYDHESSPSEQGILSEFVRTQPGAVRSLHPLFSVAALGRNAERLCQDDLSPTGFGHGSPFQRLRELDAWILCLGVDLKAMTFVHHVEQTFGVPYGYTKEWCAPVIKSGKPVARRFFAFVRYLGAGIDYDFSRLQNDLMANGLAESRKVGYGAVWCTRARAVFDFTMDQLRDEPFYLLKHPPSGEPWKK